MLLRTFLTFLISVITAHDHYFGVPYHRAKDQKLCQMCYDCGKERMVTADLEAKSEGTAFC